LARHFLWQALPVALGVLAVVEFYWWTQGNPVGAYDLMARVATATVAMGAGVGLAGGVHGKDSSAKPPPPALASGLARTATPAAAGLVLGHPRPRFGRLRALADRRAERGCGKPEWLAWLPSRRG
jgi:hypothetical protein